MTAKTNHDTPMVRDYRGVLMVPILTCETTIEKGEQPDWTFACNVANASRAQEVEGMSIKRGRYRFLEAHSTTHYNSDRTSVRIVTHVIGQRKPPVDKRWEQK